MFFFLFQILTYSWAVPKLGHVYNVTFPGDFWHNVAGLNSKGERSFTMKMFLDANYKRYFRTIASFIYAALPCFILWFLVIYLLRSPMFACIGMTDKELSWQSDYVTWPFGPCLRIFHKSDTPTADEWMTQTKDYARAWPHPYGA